MTNRGCDNESRPDSAAEYFIRGNAYADMGEHGKALADYDRAIDLRPGDADAHLNRGVS